MKAAMMLYTTIFIQQLVSLLCRVMAVRQWSGFITPASGVLLIAGGSYGLLSRLIPA